MRRLLVEVNPVDVLVHLSKPLLAQIILQLRPVLSHRECSRPDAHKPDADGVGDGLGVVGRSGVFPLFLAAGAPAHELAQFHHATRVSACGHVLLAKRGHEDVAVCGAVIVVDDADDAIGRLVAIRVGHTVAFIKQESAAPCLAVVFGKECGEVRATSACVDGAVLDEQQVSRNETADEKARSRVLDGGGFELRPCFSAVSGDALADAVPGAHEQPEGTVGALEEHVLVGIACVLRHIATAAQAPSLASIGGDDELRTILPDTPAVAFPLADRQSPFAGGKHERLAHHHPFADTARLRPLGLRGVGLRGFRAPYFWFDRVSTLRPKEKHAAIRRHPQLGIKTAHWTDAIRIDGEYLGPCRAVVAAGGEHDVVVRVFAGCTARIPNGPEPPLWRHGEACDAGEGAVGDGMLGLGDSKMLRCLKRGRIFGVQSGE